MLGWTISADLSVPGNVANLVESDCPTYEGTGGWLDKFAHINLFTMDNISYQHILLTNKKQVFNFLLQFYYFYKQTIALSLLLRIFTSLLFLQSILQRFMRNPVCALFQKLFGSLSVQATPGNKIKQCLSFVIENYFFFE